MKRSQRCKCILTWLLALSLLLALTPMALAEGDEPAEAPAPVETPAEEPAQVPETPPETGEQPSAAQEPETPAGDAQAQPEAAVPETPAVRPAPQPEADKPLDLTLELLDDEQAETCRRVTEFLREQLGLNNAAIAGILANMHRESGFKHDKNGDYGNAYGLCQWRLIRLVRLEGYCLDMGYDFETVEGQLLFLAYELQTYYPDLYEYVLLNAADTADGAERVAYYFCDTFERPTDLERSLKERCELAVQLYYPQLTEEAKEPEEELQQLR